MNDIQIGDRVKWNRKLDGMPFEGIVIEVHECCARVIPDGAPEKRMWPLLSQLTKVPPLGALTTDYAASVGMAEGGTE